MKKMYEPIVVDVDGRGQGCTTPPAVGLFRLDDSVAGARIRSARENKRWSQKYLAERATDLLPAGHSITQSHVSRVERNPALSKFYIIYAVCETLEITVSDIVEDDVVEILPG